MLTELYIKNFALIDEIRLEFKRGFTVLSGETGAGKSILIGALGLLSGGKSNPSLIREGELEAIIEGVFDISDIGHLKHLLEKDGFENEDQLILKRHFSTNGKNRIYINGQSATLKQLTEIGEKLIDLTGQHDQQILLKTSHHLSFLDQSQSEFMDDVLIQSLNNLRQNYEIFFKEYKNQLQHLNEIEKSVADKNQRLEFLKFQLFEIEKADIQNEFEEDELLIEKSRVKNADTLFEVSKTALEILDGETESLLSKLSELSSKITKASDKDQSLKTVLALIEEAKNPLSEAFGFFESYHQNIQIDPLRLDQIESRLFEISQLNLKYGPQLKHVIQKRIEIKKEVELLDNPQNTIESLKKEISQTENKLMELASHLSQLRQKKAEVLQVAIQKEMTELSMPHTQFKIEVSSPQKINPEDLKNNGVDEVEFLISVNKGESLKPLAKIASGGELSRVLLALKKVVTSLNQKIPTLIFDEIDTGVGGAVADKIGQKIREIALSHQVFCVTHLAQIASKANHYFLIQKNINRNRTQTQVNALTKKVDIENEIARLLGGAHITTKTKEHAREMMKN